MTQVTYTIEEQRKESALIKHFLAYNLSGHARKLGTGLVRESLK